MRGRWLAAAAALVLGSAAVAQQTSSPPETPPEHPGKVILSRSADQNEPAAKSAPAPPGAPATDAERQALTFLTYELDVHLRPREHAMAVRARMQVRNDSAAPLDRLPLQISSTLQWTSVRVADAPAAFQQHPVTTDIDHTGALQEAIISLAKPLAPQQTVAVDVTYEGTAAFAATRLERIGTPADVAESSDWDQVSEDFVGLRGLGNVAWYPVATVPVALGDGATFFTEAAANRQRQSQATLTMRVTEEFFGEPPTLAVLDGQTFAVTPTTLGTATVPGILTCTLPAGKVGFASPSLFLLRRTIKEGEGVRVFARTEDVDNAQAYISAANLVAPLIHRWLGDQPRGPLNVVDLPQHGDAPFEDEGTLFADVQATEPSRLTDALVHSLTHLYFRSPLSWLDEGVPSFMTSLWLEQNRGREIALQQLENNRGALSLAEPSSETTDGQPLLVARDPVYYRTKATYVFWMLRDLMGDEALARALRAYQPGSDFEQVAERASGKDLKWFFENWVYHDHGLPNFSIAGIYPSKASLPGSYIVSVDVANTGTAEAEVPVTVSSATTTVAERLRIPARSSMSHRFVLQGQPEEVSINDGTVPEVETSLHHQTIPATPSPK